MSQDSDMMGCTYYVVTCAFFLSLFAIVGCVLCTCKWVHDGRDVGRGSVTGATSTVSSTHCQTDVLQEHIVVIHPNYEVELVTS